MADSLLTKVNIVSYHKHYGWVIDGGAVHGIPQITGGETTELALFPFDRPLEQLRQLSGAISEARVLEVMPQLSKIQISGIENLSSDMTFKAVVTSLPLPPKGVLLAWEQAGVSLAPHCCKQVPRTNLLYTCVK